MITPINLPSGSGEPAVGSQLSLLNLMSPANYILVGNAGNQKWGLKVKDADTTNQGTVWTQGIPTLIEGGAFNCDLHFIPSSQGSEEVDPAGALEGHGFVSGLGWVATQRQVRQWKLTWPDGSGMFFTGYITDFPVDMNIEKDLMVNMTIKISGQPTFF